MSETTKTVTEDGNPKSNAQRLSNIFNKVSVRLAILLIFILALVYLFSAYFNVVPKDKAPTLGNYCLSFIQDVTANTVPVFILFVLSYWLLREINEFRRNQEAEDLSSRIVSAVQKMADSKPSADKFFSRRSPEESLLNHANSEMMLVQETGNLLLERFKSAVVQLLQRNGKVRMVVVTPSDLGAGLLAFRNANLQVADLQNRSAGFLAHIRDVKEAAANKTVNLEVRFCPYPVCSTLAIVDASDTRDDRAVGLIRLAGFRQPFDNKLDFTINRKTDPVIFGHYLKEFQNLWLASSKFILLTGNPHSGKTTLLSRVIHSIGSENFSFWCLSREISSNGPERDGFEVETKQGTKKFAKRLPNGEYQTDTSVWDHIADEVITATSKGGILLIDEIGPLQFKSEKFLTAINTAIENPSISIVGSITTDERLHPSLGKIKTHFRTTVLELQRGHNEEDIFNSLFSEIRAITSRQKQS